MLLIWIRLMAHGLRLVRRIPRELRLVRRIPRELRLVHGLMLWIRRERGNAWRHAQRSLTAR